MRTYSMRKTTKMRKGNGKKAKASIKNRSGFRLSGRGSCCRKPVNRIDERIPFTAMNADCYIMLSYSFTMMLCAGIAEVSSDTLTVPSNMLFTRAL